jgi:hypothetical protein
MAKPNPLQPLARILATDTQIAAWHDRMQLESRLTTAVRRLLPRALADRVRVADAAAQTLTLAVAAGAVAAVVRQRTPDLLAGLRREGWDFTELRVRVQVRTEPPLPAKILRNQRAKADLTAFRQLAATLPEGPLRAAIERLTRRCG